MYISEGLHDFHMVHTQNTVQKQHIRQVTAMLATSKNVLFSGHNHLLTTGTDEHGGYLVDNGSMRSDTEKLKLKLHSLHAC